MSLTSRLYSHQELWVPAEHLAELNRHMAGRIEVVAAYAGPGFPGRIDPATNLPVGMSSV